MNSYFTPGVFIPVLIGLIAIIGYYLYDRRRKRKVKADEKENGGITSEDKKEDKKYEPIDARIFDNNNRRVYNQELSGAVVKSIIDQYHALGRQWNREGKYVYGFIKEKEDFKPITIPQADITNPPEKLHFDMQQPEIPIIMDMREEKNFFDKYGMVLVWGAIMAFILFLMMSSRNG